MNVNKLGIQSADTGYLAEDSFSTGNLRGWERDHTNLGN